MVQVRNRVNTCKSGSQCFAPLDSIHLRRYCQRHPISLIRIPPRSQFDPARQCCRLLVLLPTAAIVLRAMFRKDVPTSSTGMVAKISLPPPSSSSDTRRNVIARLRLHGRRGGEWRGIPRPVECFSRVLPSDSEKGVPMMSEGQLLYCIHNVFVIPVFSYCFVILQWSSRLDANYCGS